MNVSEQKHITDDCWKVTKKNIVFIDRYPQLLESTEPEEREGLTS
jgi:hypothetical protein